MTTMRRNWQTPELSEMSVGNVLGAVGPAGVPLGPPGWASQGPLITGPDSGIGGGPFAPLSTSSQGPAGQRRTDVTCLPDPNLACAPFGPRPGDVSTDGPPVPISDVRLKEDITRIGMGPDGVPVYTFRYKGRQGVYEGVMAQDLLAMRPDAVVVGLDGFYRVDYAKLKTAFRRLN